MSYFFSIIIPVYNTEKYLPRALDSILAQDFDLNKIEVVVVNDGSPKACECRAIVEEYSKKLHIKFIDNEKNQGLYMARKFGIANVNDEGGYLLHLDSDDYLAKNACKILYEDIQKKGDVDYIEFAYYECKGKNKKYYLEKPISDASVMEAVLSFKRKHTIWNKCYKISFIKNIYADMPAFYAYYNEDYYQIGIIEYYAKKRRYIRKALYIYIKEDGLTSSTKYDKEKLKKMFMSIYNVKKYLCDFYKDKNCECHISKIEKYSYYVTTSFWFCCDKNDFLDAYIETMGMKEFNTFIIHYLDELNNKISAYEKKMRLLLPIKIFIKLFRNLYSFCKKYNKRKE